MYIILIYLICLTCENNYPSRWFSLLQPATVTPTMEWLSGTKRGTTRTTPNVLTFRRAETTSPTTSSLRGCSTAHVSNVSLYMSPCFFIGFQWCIHHKTTPWQDELDGFISTMVLSFSTKKWLVLLPSKCFRDKQNYVVLSPENLKTVWS